MQDGTNIAVAGFEGLRHARDQSGRRIVGDKTPGKLRGNEFGGAGTTDEKLDDLFTILYTTSMDLFSKNDFRIRIVDAFLKFELRIFARLLNGPASETTRDFGDVLLRVATVNAEGVKLHQLATVIFVQPTFLFLFVLSLRILRRQGPGKTVPGAAHLLALAKIEPAAAVGLAPK